MSDSPSVVFLADGKLFHVEPNGQPRQIESHFVLKAQQRSAETRERNRVKAGSIWNVNTPMQMDLSEMPLGAAPVLLSRFTSLAPGATPNEVYYALQTESMGGLFLLDLKDDYERRLLHKPGLELRGLCRDTESGDLACSIPVSDGSASIAVMNADGGRLKEITDGDSVDEAPNWRLGEDKTVLFQSAGIGRHEDGAIFGLGPYAICQLNIARESFHTIIEHPQFDYLCPRMAKDGTMYYIRRPYQLQPPSSPLRVLGDVALFPYRVARSMVYFLDAFSRFFSNKPIMTAGGPQRKGPDRRALRLWGRLVEINQQRHYARPNSDPPLVPSSWTLMRQSPDGDETKLATNAVAFELAADGRVYYTNGSAVFEISPEGVQTRIARARMIEQIAPMAKSAEDNPPGD